MSDLYQRISKREVYRNPWLAVEVHEIVHPTGAHGEHVLILSGRASGVLVVDGNTFIFASQPRFGAQRQYVEIVKGGADESETAFDCAKRELREELGLEATDWTPLGQTYEIPSIVDAPVELFLASGLTHVASDQEAVEDVKLVRMPIDDAYGAALNGSIDDAVTLAAMLRYRLHGDVVTNETGS